MPSGSVPQYESARPVLPRKSINSQVAGNVAIRNTIAITRSALMQNSPSVYAFIGASTAPSCETIGLHRGDDGDHSPSHGAALTLAAPGESEAAMNIALINHSSALTDKE